jgi:glycine betaine/proline transport system permease protein
MSIAQEAPVAVRRGLSLSKGGLAAILVLAVAVICRLFGAQLTWLVSWPEALTVPMTDWVGAAVGGFLNIFKPIARVFSYLLEFPMTWVGGLLGGAPWPLVLGAVTALGWLIGGARMAALAFFGFGFVVISGYWLEGMNTLALVAVSVPLAALLGAGIGILAFEYPKLKGGVNVVLDVMQTMPTFAYLTPLQV